MIIGIFSSFSTAILIKAIGMGKLEGDVDEGRPLSRSDLKSNNFKTSKFVFYSIEACQKWKHEQRDVMCVYTEIQQI